MTTQKHTNFALMVTLVMLTCCSFGKEAVVMKAKQIKKVLHLTIENRAKEVLFLGNPEKCGANLDVKADTFEGGLRFSPNPSERPWKHIVVLTPKSELEDIPRNWSWSFNIPLEKEARVSKVTIMLWVCNEREFKKGTITALRLKEFSAIVQPND